VAAALTSTIPATAQTKILPGPTTIPAKAPTSILVGPTTIPAEEVDLPCQKYPVSRQTIILMVDSVAAEVIPTTTSLGPVMATFFMVVTVPQEVEVKKTPFRLIFRN